MLSTRVTERVVTGVIVQPWTAAATAAPVYYGGGIATPPASTVGVAIAEPDFESSFGYYFYPVYAAEARLLVASGVASGELEAAAAELETTDSFHGRISDLSSNDAEHGLRCRSAGASHPSRPDCCRKTLAGSAEARDRRAYG